jgi:homoserine kinase type II
MAGEYGLAVTHAHLLPAGMENTHIKLLTTRGAVVVTYLRKKTPEQAEQYTLFLRHLNALSCHPAPRLRRRLDGAWITLHRALPAIVCDFVDGVSSPRLPSRLLHPAGNLLGQVHKDTAGFTSDLIPHLRMSADDADTLDSLPDGPFARWARSTWAGVHDFPRRDSPRAFVHADAFPDNLVVQDHDRLLLLDWEDGCRDLCALDVGVAVLGLSCKDRFIAVRARHLLAGYREGFGAEPDMALIRDAAFYAAVLIALRRHRWQTHGHLSPDPLRSAGVMARIAIGIARNWPAALP